MDEGEWETGSKTQTGDRAAQEATKLNVSVSFMLKQRTNLLLPLLHPMPPTFNGCLVRVERGGWGRGGGRNESRRCPLEVRFVLHVHELSESCDGDGECRERVARTGAGSSLGTRTGNGTGQDNKVDISALSAHNETQLERRYTTP